ncbi:MAG: hypothetical protein IJR59_02530, partial [Firmicutes bacterium]|nr:hypothetical protein [Bacillota bacterium]
ANITVSKDNLPSLPKIDLPSVGGNTKPEDGEKIETSIPGITIEMIDPDEVPDNVTDIDIDILS